MWKWKSLSCVCLCDPEDCTVRGILQARILEWVAFPFSRGSSQPRDQTQVSRIAGGFFITWATRESLNSRSPWFYFRLLPRPKQAQKPECPITEAQRFTYHNLLCYRFLSSKKPAGSGLHYPRSGNKKVNIYFTSGKFQNLTERYRSRRKNLLGLKRTWWRKRVCNS